MGQRHKNRKHKHGQGGANLAPLSAEMVPLNPGDPPTPQSAEVPQRPQKVTQKLLLQMQAYAGPIPPPDLLEHYERVCTGAANRILVQFEEQGRHRRKIENRVVWQNVFSSVLGQVLGFTLFLVAIGGGVFLLYHDKSVAGLGAIITAVGGAAWVLRKAEEERRRDLARKREEERRR